MVSDRTGRFFERPHYRPEELDRECEQIITQFLRDVHRKADFPVTTGDLTKLIERDVEDLDLYADLSDLGQGVEGVTEFRSGRRPSVRISKRLSNDPKRENRLRTTLTHEYGHVRFHAYLWEMNGGGPDLLESKGAASWSHCKRETMLDAPKTDWMEWQAGYVCGALLMPRSALACVVGMYQERHNIFGPVNANGAHGLALVEKVVETFQVSADAAHVRLAKLGHLGIEQGSSLFDKS